MADLRQGGVRIRLHVPFEVAARPKPDTPREQLRRKVDIVSRLTLPEVTPVIEIDGAQPLERVLRDVQRALWASL